jgi:hypothetical protein
MAQWRPHREVAAQRKPFSSQQQLLVMMAIELLRPERAKN